MGSLLIWDLLRLISPSHVIHLTTGSQSLNMTYDPNAWFSRDLVPVNDFTYHHSVGWLIPPAGQHSENAALSAVVDTSSYVCKFSSNQCSSKFPSDGETATTTETGAATVTLSKGTMMVKKWKMKARRKILKRLRERKRCSPAQLTSPRSNKATFIKRKRRCHHNKPQTRSSGRTYGGKQLTTLQYTNWHDCGPLQLFTFSTKSHFVRSRLAAVSYYVYVDITCILQL